jgi:hypothetical protein
MIMMRKLILGTASVLALALGIGGAALDFSANADDVPNAVGNMPSAPGSSHHWLNAANPSKDDIRWAQVELHTMGLYNGSLDGVVGPETKQALLEFQESNVDQTLFAELAEASLLRLDHDPVLDKSRGNLPV